MSSLIKYISGDTKCVMGSDIAHCTGVPYNVLYKIVQDFNNLYDLEQQTHAGYFVYKCGKIGFNDGSMNIKNRKCFLSSRVAVNPSAPDFYILFANPQYDAFVNYAVGQLVDINGTYVKQFALVMEQISALKE